MRPLCLALVGLLSCALTARADLMLTTLPNTATPVRFPAQAPPAARSFAVDDPVAGALQFSLNTPASIAGQERIDVIDHEGGTLSLRGFQHVVGLSFSYAALNYSISVNGHLLDSYLMPHAPSTSGFSVLATGGDSITSLDFRAESISSLGPFFVVGQPLATPAGPSAVPEPPTLVLAGIGALGLVALKIRRSWFRPGRRSCPSATPADGR